MKLIITNSHLQQTILVFSINNVHVHLYHKLGFKKNTFSMSHAVHYNHSLLYTKRGIKAKFEKQCSSRSSSREKVTYTQTCIKQPVKKVNKMPHYHNQQQFSVDK